MLRASAGSLVEHEAWRLARNEIRDTVNTGGFSTMTFPLSSSQLEQISLADVIVLSALLGAADARRAHH